MAPRKQPVMSRRRAGRAMDVLVAMQRGSRPLAFWPWLPPRPATGENDFLGGASARFVAFSAVSPTGDVAWRGCPGEDPPFGTGSAPIRWNHADGHGTAGLIATATTGAELVTALATLPAEPPTYAGAAIADFGSAVFTAPEPVAELFLTAMNRSSTRNSAWRPVAVAGIALGGALIGLGSPAFGAVRCTANQEAGAALIAFGTFTPPWSQAVPFTLTVTCSGTVTSGPVVAPPVPLTAMSAGPNTLFFAVYTDPAHANVWSSANVTARQIGASTSYTAALYAVATASAAQDTGGYDFAPKYYTYTANGTATGSANMSATAVVGVGCDIAAGTLNFGGIGVFNTAGITPNTASALANLTLVCTTGTRGTVYAANNTVSLIGSTGTLTAQLYADSGAATAFPTAAGTGRVFTGAGLTGTMAVYGRVVPAATNQAGAYTGAVVLTIAY